MRSGEALLHTQHEPVHAVRSFSRHADSAAQHQLWIALELLERLIRHKTRKPVKPISIIIYTRNRHPSPDDRQEFLLCIQHRETSQPHN